LSEEETFIGPGLASVGGKEDRRKKTDSVMIVAYKQDHRRKEPLIVEKGRTKREQARKEKKNNAVVGEDLTMKAKIQRWLKVCLKVSGKSGPKERRGV